MFTGLVEEIGTISLYEKTKKALRIGIKSSFARQCEIGESIATSGVCLSVIDHDDTSYYVDVMPETIRRSSLGLKKCGEKVNIERSLRLGDRLGGHLVQGHVDALGTLTRYEPGSSWTDISVGVNSDAMRFIAEKGSVCIDGVSLTVTSVDNHGFSVSLIPQTLRETTLGQLSIGSIVNIETDMFARYVARFVQT